MIRITAISLVLVMSVALSACVSSKQPAAPVPVQSADNEAYLKDVEVMKAENLPGHVKVVLAALLGAMRGEPAPAKPAVVFSPEGTHDVRDAYADLKGYSVALTEIDLVASAPPLGKKVSVALQGVFTFVNDIGQTRSDSFFVDYVFAKGKPIVIQDCVTSPVFTEYPSVTGFFVKRKALAEAAPTLNTFRDFYLFAMGNSISMMATEEETRNLEKYNALSFFDKMGGSELLPKSMEDEYAFLAFTMDRVSPHSFFSLLVNRSTNSQGNSDIEPHYKFFEEGHVVGIVQGKGKLFDALRPFYIHAMYAKEYEGVGSQTRVGMFSNQKLSADMQPLSVPPDSEWVSEKLEQRKPEVVRLLNPRDIEDAKLIQQALAAKGFYKGAIDGLFGKGSQKALRNYRKAAMGKDSSQWDMEVQTALFK
ncbi:peptidoglycan-binding protein [Desulfovibrio mangrovi]|uniref:peptidoglycan-binding domain-containing protein n=1 Tax=Desulfovibrio mangrovi TaxID=2976983 RepID=UPI002248403F|nr:peptidoglycan-binding domain-containing protein [Desulfovibrio mangrovi]UZP66045.1 peptidoglycan-binding protein [Desulfovibrio mangrovi]